MTLLKIFLTIIAVLKIKSNTFSGTAETDTVSRSAISIKLKAKLDVGRLDYKSDLLILDDIKRVGIKKFVGQTVGSFIKQKDIQNYSKLKYEQEPPFVLNGIRLKYSNNVAIYIEVKKLIYLKAYSREMKWNLQLLKKEKIFKICIVYKGVCVELAK
jgi:hypothetical protein